MNLLLDTHILIWTFLDSEKLSTFARNLIADYQNTIYFSIASMWEVEIKHNDPFDRLLISQAKASDMIFITHDKLLSGYGEPCVYTV